MFIFTEHIRKLTIEFLCLFEIRLSNTLSIFGFEGRMWDLIVSVPDHCLSFYFPYPKAEAFLIFPPLNFTYIINCKIFQTMSGLYTDRIQNHLCFHFNPLLMANPVHIAAYLSQLMRPCTHGGQRKPVCLRNHTRALAAPTHEVRKPTKGRPVSRMMLRRMKSTTIPRHGSFVL